MNHGWRARLLGASASPEASLPCNTASAVTQIPVAHEDTSSRESWQSGFLAHSQYLPGSQTRATCSSSLSGKLHILNLHFLEMTPQSHSSTTSFFQDIFAVVWFPLCVAESLTYSLVALSRSGDWKMQGSSCGEMQAVHRCSAAPSTFKTSNFSLVGL